MSGSAPKCTRAVRRGLVLIERFISETPWLTAGVHGRDRKDLDRARAWLNGRIAASKLELGAATLKQRADTMKQLWATKWNQRRKTAAVRTEFARTVGERPEDRK